MSHKPLTVLRLQPFYIRNKNVCFFDFKSIRQNRQFQISQCVRHFESYAKDTILNRKLLLTEAEIFIYVELLVVPVEPALKEKPSVTIHCSKHPLLNRNSNFIHTKPSLPPTNTPSLTQTHTLRLPGLNVTAEGVSFHSSFQGGCFQTQTSKRASLCGEADSAALHANFQAIRGLAAGVHDAAIHVARAAAVVAQFVGAAAAAATSLGRAGSARGLRHHHVAKCQELAKQAGQNAVDAAVWVKMSEAVRVKRVSTPKT